MILKVLVAPLPVMTLSSIKWCTDCSKGPMCGPKDISESKRLNWEVLILQVKFL